MFVIVVMGTLGSINVATMMDCNKPEMALLYTFIPWMFIFVPMLIALYYFPNWKAPFSNTIGYFVISFSKQNINTLIELLKDDATGITRIEVLKAPWLLFNQFTSDMFTMASVNPFIPALETEVN
jgi:hypothetical protein